MALVERLEERASPSDPVATYLGAAFSAGLLPALTASAEAESTREEHRTTEAQLAALREWERTFADADARKLKSGTPRQVVVSTGSTVGHRPLPGAAASSATIGGPLDAFRPVATDRAFASAHEWLNDAPDADASAQIASFGAITRQHSATSSVQSGVSGLLAAAGAAPASLPSAQPGGAQRVSAVAFALRAERDANDPSVGRAAGQIPIVNETEPLAPAPPPLVAIAADDPAAFEGVGQAGAFTVWREGDTSTALTVYYTVGGTASAGQDYTALSGQVVIPADADSAVITVAPLSDSDQPVNQTVVATLSANPAYDIDSSAANATVTVYEDDQLGDPHQPDESHPVVWLDGEPAVNENGQGGAARIQLWREEDSIGGALEVTYTVSGTAGEGSDYHSLSGTATIPGGYLNTWIDIVPIDDSDAELFESVILTLEDGEAYDVILSAAQAEAYIVDDPGADPNFFPDGPHVKMTIHDGGGQPVELGATRGAFTVVNRNDSDADGVADNVDTNGVANDTDLIKLILHSPLPAIAGATATLHVFPDDPNRVRLYGSSSRTGEIPIDDFGNVFFDVFDLPKTIYVELLSPGSVDFTLGYQGQEISVFATGIWATLVAVEHSTRTDQAVLNDEVWAPMPNTVRAHLQNHEGTGLRPVDPFHGLRNVILMRFDVQPAGLGEGVYVDVTRRMHLGVWYLDAGGALLGGSRIIDPDDPNNPLPPDQANDDQHNTDESDEPDQNGRVYVLDSPGTGDPTPNGAEQTWIYRANFEEFVRVQFGADPAGNTLSGSRASDPYEWHVRHRLTNVGGVWTRTTGDQNETDTNDIGPGHFVFSNDP